MFGLSAGEWIFFAFNVFLVFAWGWMPQLTARIGSAWDPPPSAASRSERVDPIEQRDPPRDS